MANTDSTNFDQQLERLYAQFQRTSPEMFQKAMEGRTDRFSAFERTCLGTMYAAANVSDEDAVWGLYDAWSASLCPTDAQTEREFALWSYADAAVEAAVITAH